jgi:hypothetical protein
MVASGCWGQLWHWRRQKSLKPYHLEEGEVVTRFPSVKIYNITGSFEKLHKSCKLVPVNILFTGATPSNCGEFLHKKASIFLPADRKVINKEQ